MTEQTVEITTLTDAIGDCEREEVVALRQELEGQTPHARSIRALASRIGKAAARERDKAIQAAVADGMSYREVATAIGLGADRYQPAETVGSAPVESRR